MFLPIRFKTSLQLTPEELNHDIGDIIIQKLRGNLEGVCSRFGYIKPGSLDIIRRSIGTFTKQHFNGHIRFEIYCKGEVCNPPQGIVVDAIVKNKNALGLLATSSITIGNDSIPVLDVIIPRKSNGIVSEVDLDQIQIGDKILTMVMGKRYQLNDTSISIIGKVVKQRNIIHQSRTVPVDNLEEVVVTDITNNNEKEIGIEIDSDIDDEEDGIDYEDDDYSDDGENKKVDDGENEEEDLEVDEDEFDEEVEEDFVGSDADDY
jgi:DNA-directed RNA polymerase subunit E'/Rpb7